MALTAAQIAFVRDNSGDDDANNAGVYELSDERIEEIYNDTTQGNSDLSRTVVFVLRRRLGKAINNMSKSSETGSVQLNQKPEQIRWLLKYWEGLTGLSGGLSIGSSATHVYRADSLQTEAPDYSNGTDVDT